MIEEGKKYLNQLDIWSGANSFLDEGIVLCSEELPYGVTLSRLDEDYYNTLKYIEYKYNISVYHIIIDNNITEKYLYFLYVPNSEVDRELNHSLIQSNEIMALKYNLHNEENDFITIPIRCEYGTVSLR